jgi:hypothetical protein
MENQEEEYQCSDCGTVVTADAKNCPKCGAFLEEVPEEKSSDEEEFVQISVSSHPANLSSILSLLDEKKIEYSINDDAMENIWGPNFIQLPKLLVRKDQIETVRGIIESLEKEEVEVLGEDVFNNSSSENKDAKKEVKGVEGWLLFFCLMLLLGPIAYLPYNINTYLEIKDEMNWIPLKDLINNIDLIATILISCISVYAGWQLWKINPGAIKTTKTYLNIVLVYSMFFFFIITIIFSFSNMPFNSISQNIFGDIIRETISSITYVIIWNLYLKNSERVKNTYVFSNNISD